MVWMWAGMGWGRGQRENGCACGVAVGARHLQVVIIVAQVKQPERDSLGQRLVPTGLPRRVWDEVGLEGGFTGSPLEGDPQPPLSHALSDKSLHARLSSQLGKPVHDLLNPFRLVEAEVVSQLRRRPRCVACCAMDLDSYVWVLLQDSDDAPDSLPVPIALRDLEVVDVPRLHGTGGR